MSLSFTLSTIFEILLVTAVVWAIFNEDKLIAFEKRIIATVKRRRLRVVKSVSSNSYSLASYVYKNEN